MAVTPQFSIIIPTRDRPGALRVALEAIARQCFEDFEAIIVDDGSTAATRAEYADMSNTLGPRFQFICDTPDGAPGRGPSAARNQAIALAQGAFLAFCDDDDCWTADDHLATAAVALAAVPDADAYYSDQEAMQDGVVILQSWWSGLPPADARAGSIAGTDAREIDLRDILRSSSFGHLNISILRRGLVAETGGFWENARYEEDLDFYLRSIDRARKILFRPRIVARHNIPDTALSQNASTQFAQTEKWLVRCMVCEHVRATSRTAAVLRKSRELQGDALRHIATHLARQGKHSAAWSAGCQAMVLKPGAKWAGFISLLGIRALLRY